MEHPVILLSLASIFGFFMAWGIGANDVANAMGTSVGSRALTYVKATIIAAIFEASGAILAGGQVTNTIRSKIIDPQLLVHTPQLLVYGMLAALLSAGVWLLIATHKGLPVSTTHSIVGAIVGFGIVNLGIADVEWQVVTNIALSWVITPIISGILAYFIFASIKRYILDTKQPRKNAVRYTPLYVFFVIFIISMVTLTKGFKHLNLYLSATETVFIASMIGFACLLISSVLLRMKKIDFAKDVYQIEKIFALLQIFTACCMAFSHGANDVANAIGPLAAIVNIVQSGGIIGHQTALPLWVSLLGAAGIVLGLATYGYKIIATVGKHITELTPSRGFSAELATATTVILASGLGLPVSTTQTLVGAVIGVAFARGISALNLNVIRSIFLSWVITLPAGATLAILFFYVFKFTLGG